MASTAPLKRTGEKGGYASILIQKHTHVQSDLSVISIQRLFFVWNFRMNRGQFQFKRFLSLSHSLPQYTKCAHKLNSHPIKSTKTTNRNLKCKQCLRFKYSIERREKKTTSTTENIRNSKKNRNPSIRREWHEKQKKTVCDEFANFVFSLAKNKRTKPSSVD